MCDLRYPISFSEFVVLATTRFVDIHTESFLKWTKLLFNYDVRQEDMQKISSGHMYLKSIIVRTGKTTRVVILHNIYKENSRQHTN